MGCAGTFQLPSGTDIREESRTPGPRSVMGHPVIELAAYERFDCDSNETWQTIWSSVAYVGGALGGGSGLTAGGVWESDEGKKNAAIVAGISALVGGLGAFVQNQVSANGVRHGCTQVPPASTPEPNPDED